MGINFYWFKERVTELADVSDGLHIGKKSAGWVFHFEAHKNPKLRTVKDYEEFLRKGMIYNEYNKEISYKDFWQIVEASKLPYNGRSPYVLHDNEKVSDFNEFFPSWENEGLAFTEWEFR